MTTTNRLHVLPTPPTPLSDLHPPAAQPPAAPAPGEPSPPHDRSTGDSQLAATYRTALLKTTGNAVQDAHIEVSPLAPAAHFSRYWSLLGRAIQGPAFSQWVTRLGVDPDSIVITPGRGRISFSLEAERDPKRVVHTLGRDHPTFAAASSEVMAIAKIVAAGNPDAAFKPPLSPRSPRAPLEVVRRFYNEPPTPTRAASVARAAELLRNNAFIELPMERYAALHDSRSETVLEGHQAALADAHARYRVGEKLQALGKDMDPITGARDLHRELTTRKVKVPLDSSYQPQSADKSNRISLKQYLDDHQLDIPADRESVDNLAAALMTPKPYMPAQGNYAGALGWPAPVDPSIVDALKAIVSQGEVGDIHFGGFKHLLEYLMDKRTVSASEARNPRHWIDNLVKSPKGKALGAALQGHFAAQSIKGSGVDWLLAALHVGNDETVPAAQADSRASIAGYPLMSADNAGKTASAVVAQLRVALQVSRNPSTAQSAALYAALLLSSRAPEFLVKDIPAPVVLGSHAWVSFVTAVGRIEAATPGATASMSYAQVMQHASIAPVTAQERRDENLAQNQALKHWAVANGMGWPANEVEMHAVRSAFDAQVKELRDASSVAPGSPPTVRDLALQALKKALPEMDPQQFDSKCITLQPAYRTLPGPYSVLDLYVDRRALSADFPGPAHEVEQYGQAHLTAGMPNHAVYVAPQKSTWVSSSSQVNVHDVLNTLRTLPDITPSFNRAFSTFATDVVNVTRTQIKHLISTLPLEDRKHLEYGNITLAREMDLAKTPTQQPRRSRTTEGSILVKTKRDGQVRTYEINRLKGEIIRRRDLGDFPTGERDLSGRYPYKAFEIITPVGATPLALAMNAPGLMAFLVASAVNAAPLSPTPSSRIWSCLRSKNTPRAPQPLTRNGQPTTRVSSLSLT